MSSHLLPYLQCAHILNDCILETDVYTGEHVRRPSRNSTSTTQRLVGTRRARQARATRSPSAMTPTAPLVLGLSPTLWGMARSKNSHCSRVEKVTTKETRATHALSCRRMGMEVRILFNRLQGRTAPLFHGQDTPLPWCHRTCKPGPDMEDHHVAKHTQYNYHDTDHSAALHRMFGSS